VPPPLDKLDNEWIWGKTGVGKSTIARKENPGFYDKSHNKWFENYKNEEVILIDDLSKDAATWIASYLLRWGDHYPFPIDVKYASNNIRPKRIIVTSNFPPSDFFAGDTLDAILRRYKVRHIVALEKVDASPNNTTKRAREGVDSTDLSERSVKKPALYRQDADGAIVLNTHPVVQSTLDSVMQDLTHIEEKVIESVAAFIEKL